MYTHAVVAVAVAFATWQVQNWRFNALEKERVEMVAKEQARKADRIDTAAVGHETDKAAIRKKSIAVAKEIEHEVKDPVYSGNCLPPGGLRIVNDLIEGKTAGESATAVSGPDKAR